MDGKPTTPSQLIWQASGRPAPRFPLEPTQGQCATCCTPLTEGVPHDLIAGACSNPTFSRHADCLRFGSHVCPACAWMYGFPKECHRNVLATSERVWWPMLAWDSATPERPSWYEVLQLVAAMPGDTPLAGVLTTDPKPRLWPYTRSATVGSGGLYVHAPDYDTGGFFALELVQLLSIIDDAILPALALGFAKRSVFLGLWRDYARASKRIPEVRALEAHLAPLRQAPEFIPALLVAGKRKEEKAHAGTVTEPLPSGDPRGQAGQDRHRQLQLF